MKKCFASLKHPFRNYETFSLRKLSKKNLQKCFFVSSWGKVVFESYAYPFGYFFRHCEIDNVIGLDFFSKTLLSVFPFFVQPIRVALERISEAYVKLDTFNEPLFWPYVFLANSQFTRKQLLCSCGICFGSSFVLSQYQAHFRETIN